MRALALAVLLTGCGASTIVDAAKYRQSCTGSGDCTAVFSGDQCSICLCPNAGINNADADAFHRAATEAVKHCGPRPAIACAGCPDIVDVCLAGKCAVQLTDGGTP